MNNLIVRPAKETDLQGILEIYNDAILTTTSVYSYKPHTIEMRREWYEEKLKKHLPVLVAEMNGFVAGFATYGPFRIWAAYKYTVENSVYVRKEMRGQGIGKNLLKELIEQAKKSEVHALVAGIDADNAVSIRLHEKFGFVEAGHFKQVGYKFQHWLDLKLYELVLDSHFVPTEE
jgi:L-amino acid N-acyltransferase